MWSLSEFGFLYIIHATRSFLRNCTNLIIDLKIGSGIVPTEMFSRYVGSVRFDFHFDEKKRAEAMNIYVSNEYIYWKRGACSLLGIARMCCHGQGWKKGPWPRYHLIRIRAFKIFFVVKIFFFCLLVSIRPCEQKHERCHQS